MTIFDLAQALGRQKRFLRVGFTSLVVLTLVMSFTIRDGGPAWRFGPRYQATVQIGVTRASVEDLTVAGAANPDYIASANLYAELARSAEAATFMGRENGFEISDPVEVKVSERAPTFSVTVIGPSEEQATGAALAAYDWLAERIEAPVESSGGVEQGPAPVKLDGPFDSAIELVVDESGAALPGDLFLIVDSGINPLIARPMAATAGRTEQYRATLAPGMSVQLTVEDSAGRRGRGVRLATPELPDSSSEVPRLRIEILPDAVQELGIEDEDSSAWSVVPEGVAVTWEGGPEVAQETGVGEPVHVLLLTPDPVPVPMGERRGPILMGAFLGVGAVLLLAVALAVDSWAQERGPRPEGERKPSMRERLGGLREWSARQRDRVERATADPNEKSPNGKPANEKDKTAV